MGLTVEDIDNKGFPLPRRDMRPLSLEERIICFADKFYSKDKNNPHRCAPDCPGEGNDC